ncbi:MAG: SAM-dependent DNA methyltransferase, partial [Verrucomicrobia bacterium]|nr:SAM-dependent DNA methyltransferase [Verrucomicrobiota bacterium]
MQNHSEIAEFLWKIADLIKDDYEAKDYEDVILPFTLLRRLDCVLEPTRDAVRKAGEKYKKTPAHTRDALLKKAAGQSFYNTSEYSLADLLKFPNDLGENFGTYLSGFSANVQDILFNFSGGEEKGLAPIYETLLRKRLLFKVTQGFAEADLSPATVDNHGMGTIFEYLIRKFKEASNEAAGQFYTPRDIIRLMVKLVFEPDRAKLAKEKLIAIYDPACGTGGMLTIAKEHLLSAVNPDLTVYLYGQEINEKTYAVAKADMLMKGEDPENIKRENTLSRDLLTGHQFNYMLSNPPFGKDWKNIREEIEAEHSLGAGGRYGPGLPDVGDGAMLFLLHKMSKLPPQGGKIAIIFSGSPLFNGDAGSGPSNIRKHILEHDWLDAIIALPSDLFYNTPLGTYIWLINNRKPEGRRGKVQLINATAEEFTTLLAHNLGKKRFEIGEDQSASILGIYEAFEETKISKIFDTTDFGYTKVCVERPLRLRYDLTTEQRKAFRLDAAVLKLKDDKGDQLTGALDALAKQALWNDDAKFFAALTNVLPWKLPTGLVKTIRALLGVRDENAETVKDDGQPVPDSGLRDYENVPLKEDIGEYFKREVLPHVPDAWMDRSKDKIGYQINFTRYFFENAQLRSTTEVTSELVKLEEEAHLLLPEDSGAAGVAQSANFDFFIPWTPITSIPANWTVLPCKALVENIEETNEGATNQNYLSLMANRGIIPYEEKGSVGNRKPDDLTKCKLVKRGDLVLNSMNYGIGSYGMS